MRTLPLLFGLLFALTGPLSVRAEEVRYYDVEVIILESKDAYDRQSEQWKTGIQRQEPQTFIELGQPYPGPLPAGFDPRHTFKPLPKSALRMQQEIKLLEASDRYRILYHDAWRQPGMDTNTALPVRIRQAFIREGAANVTPQFITTDRPASALPLPGAPPQTRNELDGFIRIILSRYLHAEVDLLYTAGLPVNPLTIAQAGAGLQELTAPPVVYRLRESRRMRSTEIHYLDHPVLGVIILITPFTGK